MQATAQKGSHPSLQSVRTRACPVCGGSCAVASAACRLLLPLRTNQTTNSNNERTDAFYAAMRIRWRWWRAKIPFVSRVTKISLQKLFEAGSQQPLVLCRYKRQELKVA
jgi:hypothetical protein